MFKKGDIIYVNSLYFHGVFMKYKETSGEGIIMGDLLHNYTTDSDSFFKKGEQVGFKPRYCKKAPVINDLNKKLYPKRVEKNGYLIPKNSPIIKEGK